MVRHRRAPEYGVPFVTEDDLYPFQNVVRKKLIKQASTETMAATGAIDDRTRKAQSLPRLRIQGRKPRQCAAI